MRKVPHDRLLCPVCPHFEHVTVLPRIWVNSSSAGDVCLSEMLLTGVVLFCLGECPETNLISDMWVRVDADMRRNSSAGKAVLQNFFRKW